MYTKEQAVKEAYEMAVRDAEFSFKSLVNSYLKQITELSAHLERLKKEFNALQYIEPTLPDLS